MTRFHKMHGLGNDFVIFDRAGVTMDGPLVRAIADRNTGVGCDQLIVVEPDGDGVAMRIWNADGGEVEACGNAARCVAALVGGGPIRTPGGELGGEPDGDGATVTLPPPRFEWDAIPLAYPMDTAEMPVGWDGLGRPVAVNVGNPHAVFFTGDVNSVALDEIGPRIEADPLFPERVNVNVAAADGDRLALRTWERGVGLTRACGTGACATAVAAIRRGLARSPVRVAMPGGELTIDWSPGQPIRMTGPATHVFAGEIDLQALVIPAHAGTSTASTTQIDRGRHFAGVTSSD